MICKALATGMTVMVCSTLLRTRCAMTDIRHLCLTTSIGLWVEIPAESENRMSV